MTGIWIVILSEVKHAEDESDSFSVILSEAEGSYVYVILSDSRRILRCSAQLFRH